MKIYKSWKRHTPDSVSGERITVTITYSSFDKGEIDEFEKTLPKGLVIMDTDKSKRNLDEVRPWLT